MNGVPHDESDAERSPYDVDWAEDAPRLGATARDEGGWNASVARVLARPGDRTAIDIGCGGGGMTFALAAVLGPRARVIGVDGSAEVLAQARAGLAGAASGGAGPGAAGPAGVEFVHADLHHGFGPVREAVTEPADIVWACASVHHLGDQQAGVTALAALLGPDGRLALAEGGLHVQRLPWDLGLGEPGLELRMIAAKDRWFGRMRAQLPGSVPMPYGWTETLRRAGLDSVGTMSWLIEKPAPLSPERRVFMLDGLAPHVRRLGETGLLDEADVAAWARLLDPDDPAWLGNREDLYHLEVRSVHVGVRR